MSRFLKYLRILDASLGIFLALGILTLFIVGLNHWDSYWPLPQQWTPIALFGAFGLYMVTRITLWVLNRFAKKNTPDVPKGTLNDAVAGLVSLGLIACAVVIFMFVSALSNVGRVKAPPHPEPAHQPTSPFLYSQ